MKTVNRRGYHLDHAEKGPGQDNGESRHGGAAGAHAEVKLCVNIDHIATRPRGPRHGVYPDPLEGARLCEESGAHGITVHLREDRRHIQDRDVVALKDIVKGKYNLEMALSDEIIAIAKKIKPDQVTLVPEKREEMTTEGGLDVAANFDRIRTVVKKFHDNGIIVSLFIEPDKDVGTRARRRRAPIISSSIPGPTAHAADAFGGDLYREIPADVKGELDRIYRAPRITLPR